MNSKSKGLHVQAKPNGTNCQSKIPHPWLPLEDREPSRRPYREELTVLTVEPKQKYSDDASPRNPELRSQLIRSSSTLPAAAIAGEAQDSTDI